VTRFTVVSIHPELVEGALSAGVVGRARAGGILDVATVNPRDFTRDRHRSVDDTPYGGGPGMVMRPGPLIDAIAAATARLPGVPARRILLAPGGAPLTQARVRQLAELPHLVLVCGRYEGIDERVVELAIDEEISLGDFVLTGGELGAAAIVDAVARLVPGVLGEPASAAEESFTGALLEYPQYTRPAELAGRAIPEVLISGHHEAIRRWRRREALRRTARRRPDLLARHRFTGEDEALARELPELTPAARVAVALVHHPVFDRTGAVVTTALTNLDLHDIARAAATYGLAACYVVTPIETQRDKCAAIAEIWREEGKDHRLAALARVHAVASIAEAIAHHGGSAGDGAASPADPAPVRVVATTASSERFAGLPRVAPETLASALVADAGRTLLLFGTGWGLVDSMIPEASQVLAPIEARAAWNHLSVRSAVAVVLDRLFGLRAW
jgi:tRNA (guanine37-N1)-methyltransferase